MSSHEPMLAVAPDLGQDDKIPKLSQGPERVCEEETMRIVPISEAECLEVLQRQSIGRLACALDNQPYIVPLAFAYEDRRVYVFSTNGKKIGWMRQNPKVCLEVDEISNRSNWISVVITGKYLELSEPQFSSEIEHAKELLAQHSEWWRNALAERREQVPDNQIEPVFFRINVEDMSGMTGRLETWKD